MIQSNNIPKIAVVCGFFVVCTLFLGATIKQAIIENKAPKIQKVQVVNYGEILKAVEQEKKELLDSIKNEIKTLKLENEQLLAKANVKPRIIIVKEKQTEIQTNRTNQIVVSERYTPHVQIIQKKSGMLEVIE